MLSVIVPFHDGRPQVADLVEALLRSTDERIEVIAVDDGSSDGAGDALRSSSGDRFTLLRHDRNRGVSAARNSGARRAIGRHLLFLDSDDQLPSGAVDLWLGVLDEDCRLAFGRASARRPDGTAHRREPRDLGPAFNHVRGLFLAGAFVVRRDLFEQVGGYDEALRFSENSELGMRLSDLVDGPVSDVRSIDDTVVVIPWRHDRAREHAEAQLDALSRIVEIHAVRMARDASLESDYLAVAGVAAFRIGRPRDGRRQLWRSFRRRPTWRTGARSMASLLPAPLRPW